MFRDVGDRRRPKNPAASTRKPGRRGRCRSQNAFKSVSTCLLVPHGGNCGGQFGELVGTQEACLRPSSTSHPTERTRNLMQLKRSRRVTDTCTTFEFRHRSHGMFRE